MKYEFEITHNGKVIQSGKIESGSVEGAYYKFIRKVADKYGLMTYDEAMAKIRKKIDGGTPDFPPGFEDIFGSFRKK